jgi:hypothetical protein
VLGHGGGGAWVGDEGEREKGGVVEEREAKRRGFFVCVCSPLLLPPTLPALLLLCVGPLAFLGPVAQIQGGEEEERRCGVDRAARWSPRGAGGDKSLSWPVWNFLWPA